MCLSLSRSNMNPLVASLLEFNQAFDIPKLDSPDIGPDELMITSLVNRIKLSEGEIKEVILALSGTLEGDTTAFYLTKQLEELDVEVTSITRGIPVGGELEYADEVTLGRSIITRSKVNID